jgi:cytochrome b involved in lipid metabolism
MFDWTHYTQSAGDLTGVGGQLQRVSAEELVKHDTEEDAWTVVRGMRERKGEGEREGVGMDE